MMNHALRLASRGRLQLSTAKAISFTTASTAASSCSDLRTPLPGAYRETTELWHNDNTAEGRSDVKQWVWDNRQFRRNSPPPPPQAINSEADLTEILALAKPDSLVVVNFHATLCRASRAIEKKYKRTAAEFAGTDGQDVTFADVCFDSNRQLCERMGIRSVPHVQIFSGSCGKIADFSIAPHQYNTLTSLLADRRESVRAQK
ncbi:unnamed protein product [Pylaiella littoralis]